MGWQALRKFIFGSIFSRFAVLLNLARYICLILGLIWLILLPLEINTLSIHNPSENALLPGQTNSQFFLGQNYNIEASRALVESEKFSDCESRYETLSKLFEGIGLKYSVQYYQNPSDKKTKHCNIYAVIEAPRSAASEAILLVSEWPANKAPDHVSVLLALGNYLKRWSLWSKDIILLFPDSAFGLKIFLDAYHLAQNNPGQDTLEFRSGSLQAALCLEKDGKDLFSGIEIMYDSNNGQLPNLDFITTTIIVVRDLYQIPLFIHDACDLVNNFWSRFKILFRGVHVQAKSTNSNINSLITPYKIDALLLTVREDGNDVNESRFGLEDLCQIIESILRSLNNLHEHFHQSYFLYLLCNDRRFVNVGNYLPAAILIAASYNLKALSIWISIPYIPRCNVTISLAISKWILGQMLSLAAFYFLKILLPFRMEDYGQEISTNSMHFNAFYCILGLAVFHIVPLLFEKFIEMVSRSRNKKKLNDAQRVSSQLCQIFCYLLFGIFLSVLSTLNFSLAIVLGTVASPLLFLPDRAIKRGNISYLILFGLANPFLHMLFYAVMEKTTFLMLVERYNYNLYLYNAYLVPLSVFAIYIPTYLCLYISCWSGPPAEKEKSNYRTVNKEREQGTKNNKSIS